MPHLWEFLAHSLLGEINYLSLILCVFLHVFLEGLWYSSWGFGSRWRAELNIREEDIERVDKRWNFLSNFVLITTLCLIMALFIAIQGANTFVEGMLLGFLWGSAFAIVQGMNYVYERRSRAFYLIVTGYPVLFFSLIGGILAAT